MSAEVLDVLLLTLRIATVATAAVAVPATVLGYVLARFEFRGKRTLTQRAVQDVPAGGALGAVVEVGAFGRDLEVRFR